MESIRDTEDDAGPVFKRSRLAGAATYTVFGLLISPRSFEVTKLRYTITIFMWRCENRKGRLKITIHKKRCREYSYNVLEIDCMSHSWSKQISLLVQADLTPGPEETLASLCLMRNLIS